MSKLLPSLNSVLTVLLLVPIAVCADAAPLDDLRVPAGFRIEVLAEVPSARALAIGDRGTLFVGTLTAGQVYAVTDPLGGNREVAPFGMKQKIPAGVAFRDGDLYVASPGTVVRYRDAESRLDNAGEPEVVIAAIPSRKRHAWHDIGFGPDDRLYVTVGAPCNVCAEDGFGLIFSTDAEGKDRQDYAAGVRNSVGVAWHPVTGDLWFTDNNRDMMGDDMPPGELNRAPEAGLHFGFPFCHGADIVEPEADLAALGECAAAEAPEQELPAHVAALGLAIYDGMMFPEEYRNQVFIAEHGSWNRSQKIGYRVSLVRLDDSGTRAVSLRTIR